MPRDYTRDVVRRPRPVVGTTAVMAEAQGASFWVGGGTPMPTFNAQNNTVHGNPPPGGAANRIPPEIALKISKYLNVKDLARTAMVGAHFGSRCATHIPAGVAIRCNGVICFARVYQTRVCEIQPSHQSLFNMAARHDASCPRSNGTVQLCVGDFAIFGISVI